MDYTSADCLDVCQSQRHDKDMVTRYTVLEPGSAMGLPS